MVPSPPPRTKLVLLPGIDGTELLFEPLLAVLPDWIEPVVVTYPPDGDNGYADLLAPVAAAVAATGSCHVLGWSFSGPLALRIAGQLRGRVRSVTLVSSFVQSPMSWLSWTGPLLATPAVAAIRTLRRLPIWLLRPPQDPYRVAKSRIWGRVPARTLARRARAVRGVDGRRDLVECPAPVLYLAASDDTVVPAHNLAAIRALRPDVEIAMIPGDHFALYRHPLAAATAIVDFVARQEMTEGTAS